METTLTDRFALVQDVYELDDWQTAAVLLTEILGRPAVTARQQARKSHGYLASYLSGELNYSEALGDTAPDVLVDANARMEGFRLLILSIASRASHVHVPAESAALLTKSARESAQVPASATLDDFNAVNRWLLQRLLLV